MNFFSPPYITAVEETSKVTNGLVMEFDASNRKSYFSGSGRFWRNLVPNKTNAAVSGTLLYTSSVDGGWFTLNGTNGTMSIPYHASYDPTVGITFESVIYGNSLNGSTFQELYRKESGNRHLFSFQGNATILSMGITTSITGYEELDVAINSINYNNQWTHLVATYTSGFKAIYRNSTQIGSTTGQIGTIVQANVTGYLGSFGAGGEFLNARYALFRMYDRRLLPAEITQNFNTVRQKYNMR